LFLSLGLSAQAASVATFGGGCKGPEGTPSLDPVTNSRPQIGKKFTMTLKNLPTAVYKVPFGVLGVSKTRWKSTSLPLDLSVLGAQGCNMHISPDHMEVLKKVGSVATWEMQIPNSASIVGVTVYLQCWASDHQANAAGLVVSGAAEAKLGST
jgi:hypothetical protein